MRADQSPAPPRQQEPTMLQKVVSLMGNNLRQAVPFLDEGRGMGTLGAYWRGGLKDL
ncbi:MAG TPA: hypothetical protein VNK04_05840 [Gemmataceae bacterium]|nr:hypothetical protein [Gemmataceae bacterium]